MKHFSPDFLFATAVRLFCAYGVPVKEAEITAHELVDANLYGLDSHGFIRCIFYVEEILAGHLHPGAMMEIVSETQNTAILDAHLNFGQVAANRMVDIVWEKAKEHGIACVISRHAHHVGRLGAYTGKLAERGLLSLAMCNGYKMGHFVAPFGGCEGRLATNPFSYAVPAAPHPVVLDMSTSMIAEGKIRILMQEGKLLPPGCVIDANGVETRDPCDFYGPPHGSILPFGGTLGYKGFGLSLMVECFGGVLAGEAVSDHYTYLNGLCLIALNPEFFFGLEPFRAMMEERRKYLKSSRAAVGSDGVMLPGEYDFKIREQRLKKGVPIQESVWRQIVEIGARRNVQIDDYGYAGEEREEKK